MNRSATFVFFIGDRFFGTLTAFVPGADADDYEFTSSLSAQVLKHLLPTLKPLIDTALPPAGAGASGRQRRKAKRRNRRGQDGDEVVDSTQQAGAYGGKCRPALDIRDRRARRLLVAARVRPQFCLDAIPDLVVLEGFLRGLKLVHRPIGRSHGYSLLAHVHLDDLALDIVRPPGLAAVGRLIPGPARPRSISSTHRRLPPSIASSSSSKPPLS